MTNAQKPNKHQRNKTDRRTTTKGPRGSRKQVLQHGKGKGVEKIDTSKKRKVAK